MRAARRGLLFVAALAAAWATPAEDTDPRLVRARALVDAVRRIESFYREAGSFRCGFEEVYASDTFGQDVPRRGVLHVEAPRRLLVDYSEPEGDRVVYDGELWSILSVEDRELERFPPPSDDPGPLLGLLTGRVDLLALFTVTGHDAAAVPGRRILELVPRDATQEFDRLLLEYEEKSAAIRRIEAVDPLGGRVVYRFGVPEFETPLPDERYQVELPAGYVLIE